MYSKCYKRVLFISRTTPLVCVLRRDTVGKKNGKLYSLEIN